MKISKKILKIALSILGGFFVLIIMMVVYVIFQWETNTAPCIPEVPKRIDRIPGSAKWKGGCDGGYWFDVVEVNNNSNRFRVRIYYDYNGEVFTDEYYTTKADCQINYNKKTLLDDILLYDGLIIHLGNYSCNLIPIRKKNKKEIDFINN